jgi:hypothetical protein
MLLFIVLSLVLCFLVQTENPLQNLLISPFVIYAAIPIALLSMAGVILKKAAERLCYDVFASSLLLAWFAYWRPIFKDDSPIFFFYPLYFVFMGAFIALFFTDKSDKLDKETLYYMRSVAKNNIIQPWLIMLLALVSLELRQHYMLYPVMMTLLMIRVALSSYLERE